MSQEPPKWKPTTCLSRAFGLSTATALTDRPTAPGCAACHTNDGARTSQQPERATQHRHVLMRVAHLHMPVLG
ncbi:hypothetical protein [Spirosoma montaniterrae]|uniref:hypothetical protein n=1 Tax=Spirosoma montaniterrae TaxID=1178516 RepID=UPI0012F8E0A1|nr:hypothetical protein [Spirosoma montaniterrae]